MKTNDFIRCGNSKVEIKDFPEDLKRQLKLPFPKPKKDNTSANRAGDIHVRSSGSNQ